MTRTLHLASVLIVGMTTAARAEPASQPSASAQAETLFRQGRELLAAGKIAEACAAFDSSDHFGPAITTLLNQAACREQNGNLATAWGHFVEAERQTRDATEPKLAEYHAIATAHAATIEPRLSHLTITVPASVQRPGLEISRASSTITIGEWGRALPVDGGSYTIIAKAPGFTAWSTTISVGTERDEKTVVVQPLKPVPSRLRAHALPAALGGGALVLIGGAIAFELTGENTSQQSMTASASQRAPLWNTANMERHVAEGLAVGGIALAAVAVWAYLRDDRGSEPALGRIGSGRIEPLVTSDRAGVQLLGHF
jgi:hypothetical protein